jgi:hypothetical protein
MRRNYRESRQRGGCACTRLSASPSSGLLAEGRSLQAIWPVLLYSQITRTLSAFRHYSQIWRRTPGATPEGRLHVGSNYETGRQLASCSPHPSSLARSALHRQTYKVRSKQLATGGCRCVRQTNRSQSPRDKCTKLIEPSNPMVERPAWTGRRSSSSRQTCRTTSSFGIG